MSIIVGINAYHGDAAACIIINGHLVAAVEEERFLRIKHWAGFPAKSVEYCLAEAGVTLSDVDIIAVNSDPKANLFKKIVHIFKHRSAFELIRDRFRNAAARELYQRKPLRGLSGSNV